MVENRDATGKDFDAYMHFFKGMKEYKSEMETLIEKEMNLKHTDPALENLMHRNMGYIYTNLLRISDAEKS